MSEDVLRPSHLDEEHLKLLSLGYNISAAVNGFYALFGLFYVFMGVMLGVMFKHAPEFANNTNQPPPAFIGWIFAGFGVAFILLMSTFAALKLAVASRIKRRRSRTFCLVIAGITCLEIPYGTVLGVFTFVVLGRESVMRLFGSSTVSQPIA
jgi:hypothetical protein